MKIESKYDIGDKIEYKGFEYEEIEIPCEFCGGTGLALDYQGHAVECPCCEGMGALHDEKYIPKNKTGRVREILVDTAGVNYVINSYYNTVKESNVLRECES